MAQGLGFVVMVHNYAFISYREILNCKKSCKDLAIGWCAPTPAILAVLSLIFILYIVGSALANMLYQNKAFLSSQEYTEYHKQSFRKNLYYQSDLPVPFKNLIRIFSSINTVILSLR